MPASEGRSAQQARRAWALTALSPAEHRLVRPPIACSLFCTAAITDNKSLARQTLFIDRRGNFVDPSLPDASGTTPKSTSTSVVVVLEEVMPARSGERLLRRT